MGFTINKTSKGKDCISIKPYKYRKDRVMVNGNINWRCLGRTCAASVRTDADMTEIISHKNTHSGDHPVTMMNTSPALSSKLSKSTLPADDSFVSLESSPLISQTILKPRTCNVECQTDLICLEPKDKLVSRIQELTAGETLLIDRIQQLTLELESEKAKQLTHECQSKNNYSKNDIVSAVSTSTEKIETNGQSIKSSSDFCTECMACKDKDNINYTQHKNLEALSKCKEETQKQFEKLQQDFLNIQMSHKRLEEELISKNTAIDLLTSDYIQLLTQLQESEAQLKESFNTNEIPFQLPNKTCTQKLLTQSSPTFVTENRFSTLTNEELTKPVVLEVKVDVHRPDSSTPMKSTRSSSISQRKNEKQLLVLADSHGKNLYYDLANSLLNTDVTVVSKPGAKLKHVVREGQALAKQMAPENCVVVFAGTNDVGKCEPYQLTLHQGLEDLLSWDVKTNVIVLSLPYRYDIPDLNNIIYYANERLKHAILRYKGQSRIRFVDVNENLQRRHYTNHGLHLSKRGKKEIACMLANIVAVDSYKEVSVGRTATTTLAMESQDDMTCKRVLKRSGDTQRQESCGVSAMPSPDIVYLGSENCSNSEDPRLSAEKARSTRDSARTHPRGRSVSFCYAYYDLEDDDASPFSLSMVDFPPLPNIPGASPVSPPSPSLSFLESPFNVGILG